MSESNAQRKSFGERRQTVVLQMEKMFKEVKTKYRKRIAIAAFVGIVLLTALIVYIVITRRREKDICLSDECEEYAIEVYSNLNTEVDPCSDFYEFACGGWKIRNPRPKNKEYWSTIEITYEKIYKHMRERMDSGFEDMKNSITLQKVYNFYKGCKNFELRNSVGVEALRSNIHDKIGWFPMASVNDSKEDFDLEKIYVYVFTSLLSEPFFTLFLVDDKETNYTTSVSMLLPPMNLRPNLGFQNATRSEIQEAKDKYRQQMTKIVLLVYPQLTRKDIDDEMDDVLELWVKLCKAYGYENEKGEKKKRLTLDQMEYTFPKVNWFRIFSEIWAKVDIKLTREEAVEIRNVNYFENLGSILSSTILQAIAEIGSATIPRLQQIQMDPDDKKDDPTSEERIKSCYFSTEVNFKVAVNYIFVKSYFSNESLTELKDFVNHLKASVTLTIQESEWMDDDTKMRAQLKLNKMLDYIAAPSSISNEQELDNYYSDIRYISTDNYYSAYKKMTKWNLRNGLRTLRKDDEMAFGPSIVNAMFFGTLNKIAITSGILNPPFYHPSAPVVMNFGGIGTIIGHEITHGFDPQGANYDEIGRYRNWWKNDTKHKFQEKIDCFIKQYSEKTEPVTGKKVNGTLTIGDNIADNGGLKQSFRAYKIYTSTKEHKMDLRLPKVMSKFSKDQLFFIAYATSWCNDHAKSYLESQLKYDAHAPERIRITVPLSNSEEFAKAFNCPEGSPMNPSHKCLLW